MKKKKKKTRRIDEVTKDLATIDQNATLQTAYQRESLSR